MNGWNRKETLAWVDRLDVSFNLTRNYLIGLVKQERQARNEQVEQAYGQAMKLFGSLQSKLLALEEHLGVEVVWEEPKLSPGKYAVKKKAKR